MDRNKTWPECSGVLHTHLYGADLRITDGWWDRPESRLALADGREKWEDDCEEWGRFLADSLKKLVREKLNGQ